MACTALLILNFSLTRPSWIFDLLISSILLKISLSSAPCSCRVLFNFFNVSTFSAICGFSDGSSTPSVGCSTGLVVGVSVGFVVGCSVGFIVGFGVCFFLTVILHLYFFFLTLAVIVTLPAFLPFTFPFY